MSAPGSGGDVGGSAGDALSEALVGLPAEVKVVGSEADSVVPLEEIAMRALHRLDHRRPKGEEQRTDRRTSCPCLGAGIRSDQIRQTSDDGVRFISSSG